MASLSCSWKEFTGGKLKVEKKCKQKCQTIYIPKSKNNFQLTHQDKVRQGNLYKCAFFLSGIHSTNAFTRC